MAVREIDLALLFRDDDGAAELAGGVWAALHEVRALYRLARPGLGGQIFYFGSRVPNAVKSGQDSRILRLGSDEWVTGLRAVGDRACYDPAMVARFVKLLSERALESRLVVVTDLEVGPPPVVREGPRYGPVLSLRPLDPRSASTPDPDRARTIKYRARAACCAIVGELVGLSRCGDARCFLYGPIDSAQQLDDMRMIGHEHENPAIAAKTFRAEADPETVEPLVDAPAG